MTRASITALFRRFSLYTPLGLATFGTLETLFGSAERFATIQVSPLQEGEHGVHFKEHPNEQAHERMTMSLYEEIRGFLDGNRTVHQ